MRRRLKPSVNAGSMADIAFLLLIFFLVTTTIETDKGIPRTLAAMDPEDTKTTVRERNLLQLVLNEQDKILVDDYPLDVHSLKDKVIGFLDNGGDKSNQVCTYCMGKHNPLSSDHPNKAIISFQNSRNASYSAYIQVQDVLLKAYTELYDREAQRLYGVSYTSMKMNLKDLNYDGDKNELRTRIQYIHTLYPQMISESEISMQ